jgi:hypothetical protein
MELSLVERYIAQIEAETKGEKVINKITLKEALSTPDLSQFLQTTIIDVIKDTAEPMYIASKMFKTVRIAEGRSIIFPAMSDIKADKVPEMGNYPQETPDVNYWESTTEVSVQKVGLIVRVSDEMVTDSQWDVIGVMLQKAGRAMARYKEEWCFKEFTHHGHVIFDPIKAALPGATDEDKMLATNGLGSDYQTKNGTLSVEDFIDLMMGNIANGYTTTDILMHPLVWPIFAKNPLLDRFSIAAFGGQNNTVSITPDQVQGKLPFAVQVTLSPFIPFHLQDKKFDMYIVDRNEIGIMLVKDDITTEQWDNPERDIRALKVKERYAPGILNNGKAISVATNISFAQTYALPEVVRMINF